MFNYNEMSAIANELLTEFGQTRTFIRPGGITRVNGEEITAPDIPYDVAAGVLTEWSPQERQNTTIEAGDKKLVCTAGTEIKIGDLHVDEDGVKWRVEQPNPVKPAGVNVVYKLQMRRA